VSDRQPTHSTRGQRSALRPARWLAVAAMLTSSTAAQGGEMVECIIAQVNDEIITLSDYKDRRKSVLEELYRQRLPQEELNAQLESARVRLLPSLIEETLLLQKAYGLGLGARDAEVDRVIKSIMTENKIATEHELEQRVLESEGLTLVQLRKRIKTRSVIEKLKQFEIASKVVVTDEEAQRFYDANKDQYQEVERIRLRDLVLVSEGRAKEEVKKEIEELGNLIRNGADFAELATLFSHSPSAEHGGDLGLLTTEELAPEISAAAADLAPGEVSGPIESRFGYHIVQLVERKETSYRTFEDARDEIASRVQVQQFEERVREYVDELKADAYIEIRQDCVNVAL